MRKFIYTCLLTFAFVSNIFGAGMLIPKGADLPPLAIKNQRVDIQIKDGVATVKIEQVFKNSVDRDLEATYIFPLPENASIADFAMYIGGKRMSGELVEKDKARKIYEDIVRRMKDPGLLEHMDGNLFRVRVYPVPRKGEQKIELEYSQTLQYESGLYKLVYPLKTGEKAAKTLEDFTVSAKINSALPLKNIYSPSHKVGIQRKGDNEAVLGFEEEEAALDRDFVLYYGVSKKDFGLNLLSHAVKGEDGYFMMMLSPKVVKDGEKVIKKDVVFVFDTSGSMAGEKMDQARKALEYCIKRLNDGDRFNIIGFSTDIEPFEEDLVPANKKNRDRAMKFIGDMEARGGTFIDGALEAALKLKFDEERPHIIAFLTDGKPTIGEADKDEIVKNVAKNNKVDARIFVFGVGEKVNTHLLDRISSEQGGVSRYVAPEEDIEVKVSAFSDKMSYPVLAKLSVEVENMKIRKMHPRKLPDLFSGEQVTVFGRYSGGGHVAIKLKGEVNGKEKEYVYEGDFVKSSADNNFIPRLWATRRVGYLLDEIRLNGEKGELKDEVLKLSKEYGIMTPYTSYLVLENDQAYKQHGISRTEGQNGAITTRPVDKEAPRRWSHAPSETRGKKMSRPAVVPVFEEAAADSMSVGAPGVAGQRVMVKAKKEDLKGYFDKDSGREAIELSKAIDEYKTRDRADDNAEAVKHVSGRVFYEVDGKWIDSKYRKEMKLKKVKFASEEYFKLLDGKPWLKDVFALGQSIIVVLDDKTALEVE